MASKGPGLPGKAIGWSGGARNSASVLGSLSVGGGASIPGFLTKTYEIFSLPDHQEYCGWGPKGDTIIIRKIEPFARLILPKYFKHSNFQSFVRQLNMYDFRKTVQDPGHGEFQHPNFKVNHPELLILIRRKAHTKSGDSKGAGVSAAAAGGEGGGGGGGVAKARKGRGGAGQANRYGGRYDGGDDEEEQDQEDGDAMMGQDTAGDDLLLLGSDAELLDMSAGNYAGLQGKGSTPRQVADPTGGSGGIATNGGSSSSSRFASALAASSSSSSSSSAAFADSFSLPNTHGGASSRAPLRPGPLNRVPLETDAVLKDLVYQKTLRGEFENRLLELEDQQARLVDENKALRDLMVESKVKQDMMQERMNKILRTLYHIFSGSSSSQFQLRAGANGNVALSLRDGGAVSVADGGTLGGDANGSGDNSANANAIQLISALGERNFMDVVGYLELESPLGPRAGLGLGSALAAGGGAGAGGGGGAPAGSGGSSSFDGAPLCRLPSFEAAAASIAPAALVASSFVGGSRPGPGAPLDRMTSLDWPNYMAATATDVSAPSGQLDRAAAGSKRALSGGGAEDGIAGIAGAGVAGIAANKRQCLALSLPPTLSLTPAAFSSSSALAIDVAGAGRPPLPSKSPRTPMSVPASVAKVLAESVDGGKVIGEEESESIVKLLGQSQVGTISRLNSLELTIQELLGEGKEDGAAE